jgi:cardiolipin synthase
LNGNTIELLPDYDATIQRIIRDIDTAEHFVHLEYFIIVLDDVTEPLFAALARAVDRGVQTRVMYDWFAVRGYPRRKEMLKRLNHDGVITQAMLPFRLPGRGYVRPDLRNHRKLVVIDGHTGYTGSLNLVQKDYHRKDSLYYEELVIRLKGPIVLELSAIFSTDWYSENGEMLRLDGLGVKVSDMKSYGSSVAQMLPSGPGYEYENNLKLFTGLIHAAQKQITITNPYFVPDEALTTAIISAARRGVSVTMINSEIMDQFMVGHAQRSFYEQLLEAGVTIQLYNPPILLHSKFMTVDDDIAVIGSSNLDIRSFLLDLEVTCITYDKRVVKKLRELEGSYLSRSKRIELKEWQQRPRHQVLLDNIARLTSALQ